MLQREESRDVRLGLFQKAVRFLELLPHGRGAAAHGDAVRTEAVHQLVHHDVCEERVEGQCRSIGCAEDDRSKSAAAFFSNFASWMFFSITRFAPFSRDDALVVRQVERRGLHRAIAVAGGEDLIHHDDRRERAELWIAVVAARSAGCSRSPAARRRTSAASPFRRRPQRDERFETRLCS